MIGGDGSWVWLEGVRYGQRVVSGVGVGQGIVRQGWGLKRGVGDGVMIGVRKLGLTSEVAGAEGGVKVGDETVREKASRGKASRVRES